jgi:drug/metabolite transporter (DMT)-like permease
MFYLLATVLLNTILSAIFKVIPRYKINALQAIVANYWVCVITGSLFTGLGFICVFNMFAYSTRVDGITTSTIANKLSLAIPVIFSIILYSEPAGAMKITGIILAFPSVYLTSHVKSEDNKAPNLLWPALLFIGSGLLDTLVNYAQHSFLPTADIEATYTIHVFAAAGTVGLIVITVLTLLKKIELHWRNIIAGIFVGIPNYFSIYYFIRLLNSNFLQSSAAIPVNNIAILVASSLMAILFFREKVTSTRIIGLVLSIVAILLIAFGGMHGKSISI